MIADEVTVGRTAPNAGGSDWRARPASLADDNADADYLTRPLATSYDVTAAADGEEALRQPARGST
jgi:hypothetical protein